MGTAVVDRAKLRKKLLEIVDGAGLGLGLSPSANSFLQSLKDRGLNDAEQLTEIVDASIRGEFSYFVKRDLGNSNLIRKGSSPERL